jgi:hypothetical protein
MSLPQGRRTLWRGGLRSNVLEHRLNFLQGRFKKAILL